MRGDFGTENNGVERKMIAKWGVQHRAYLRGRYVVLSIIYILIPDRYIFSLRSIHNVRIERLWRDVRRDTLEFFRTIFLHLEEIGLLDMESEIHRVCLFLTYQHRIQHSLDETVTSWNLHKLRTAGNKSPWAIYQLSREMAINQGYWTGDPGDDVNAVPDDYGDDPNEGFSPADELAADPKAADYTDLENDVEKEREAGIFVNDDEEIRAAKECLDGMDFEADDGNFGIDIYCKSVTLLTSLMYSED